METIKKTFADRYKHWGLELPEDVPSKGEIHKAGWFVKYVIITNEEGEQCLDFIAHHRMTNSRHCRIHPDGEIEGLASYREYFSYDDDIPGDKEKKEQEYFEYNRRVSKELVRKGLE